MQTTREIGEPKCNTKLLSNMTKFEAQLCYIKNDYPDLLTLEIGDVLYKNDVAKVTSLRATEKLQICVRNYEDTGCKVTTGVRFRSKGIFNVEAASKTEAQNSLIMTTTVLIVLVVSSLLLSKDAHKIIIDPVQRMHLIVQTLSKNPLKALQQAAHSKVAKAEEKRKNLRKRESRTGSASSFGSSFNSRRGSDASAASVNSVLMRGDISFRGRLFQVLHTQPKVLCRVFIARWFEFWAMKKEKKRREEETKAANSETELLQDAITKMAMLLQVGFGSAGAAIISKNLAATGNIDPLVPGVKIHNAIFGFCDIRRFTDATEVLQEDVMLFVNTIAGIVHGQCVKTGGEPNKNIGDAFLIIWKPQEKPKYERGVRGRNELYSSSSTLNYVYLYGTKYARSFLPFDELEQLACPTSITPFPVCGVFRREVCSGIRTCTTWHCLHSLM